jgi:hypothetical protein
MSSTPPVRRYVRNLDESGPELGDELVLTSPCTVVEPKYPRFSDLEELLA